MNLPVIPSICHDVAQAAKIRQERLTKPSGSLGRLEDISVQVAGITGNPRPRFHQKGVIIMAADHGIALEGVSAYPAEVTPQMVLNFLHGGAAINVLARQANARVTVVDVGVAYDFHGAEGLLNRKISYGTNNMLRGPAMTIAQAEEAIQVGIDVVQNGIENGLDLVATGEVGIGNTTPSAAITSVITGTPIEKVTGRGTGLDDAGLNHKIGVIREAIRIHRPDPHDPLDVLSKVGGLEIAGLAGVIMGAAARRVPVVVDGFISGAAALIAAGLLPGVIPYLFAAHQSVEIGNDAIWKHLGLTPLLNLGLRLGEGTGAVLAFHVLEAAVGILDEMATFSEAGVDEKDHKNNPSELP